MKKYSMETTNYDGTTALVQVSEEVYKAMKDDDRKVVNAERQIRRNCVSFGNYAFNDIQLPLVPSVEDAYFDRLEQKEQKEKQLELFEEIYAALNHCTPKQQKRFLLYAVEGMTYREIAVVEKTSHVAAYKSIQQVQKALRNLVKKFK